ncbi:MAG: error-prone DNA polymerase [Chloroflexi bacterium]|nr:error-prone DNA polymerase [Chloroflexota bacterium]
MPALALTDHDAVYGAVAFVKAAREIGLRPLLGAELTLESNDHPHHLTLLVQNERGWANLCQLITLGRHNATKGAALLPVHALEQYSDGLIALSGCRQGEVAWALRHHQFDVALAAAQRYCRWFGRDRFYLELQYHHLPHDDALNARLADLAHHLHLEVVATNNVHYASKDAKALQDVLVCIRHNATLSEANQWLRPNAEYALKSAGEMQTLFRRYPQAIANTVRIADQCAFELTFGLQELPTFPTPDHLSAPAYLRSLCETGLRTRHLSVTEAVEYQLAHELAVIEKSGLANYFLIVWDIVRFAREQDFLCQGRGSAANSLVAYLLGISPINPLEHQLVFERFLSDERQAVPDIDIDFQADRREEVIQYVYGRYGHEHAAMACTFITFRARSALRDVGKALGLPPELLDRAARAIDTFKSGRIAEDGDLDRLFPSKQTFNQLIDLADQIDGLPRHLGIHNGGMIVMGAPLATRLPTEPATMPDRYVVQWDKDSLEDAGLVKIDILGLRMLSAIAETKHTVEALTGDPLNLDALRFDDAAVYDMVSAADTIGVFQVESRAQQQVLPRMRPRQFNDLIISISLIRPGPIQGNMVHPYLRRRLGEEPVKYPHPLLQPALAETLGVVLFQEQVLKVARDLAGFTGGYGEGLRRALGSKRASAALDRFHADFVAGALKHGVEESIADAVFDTLRAFGGYSFPKSHAAAFAVLVYRSAWLKRYHPAAFAAALLNHQPMGFWSPATIVSDAKRHGIQVLPVEINRSAGVCTLEDEAIRLGFNAVKGCGDDAIQRLLLAREAGAFTGLADLCRRTQLPRRLIEHLILSGALDAFGPTRRSLVWELGKLDYRPNLLPLDTPEDSLQFPAVSVQEVMGIEYEILGLSLRDHLMTLYRERLAERGVRGSRQLTDCVDGETVTVAGQILVHQAPPTAKGHHFVTLEDEDGFINLVVRPDVYADHRRILRESPLVIVQGLVQRSRGVLNVIVHQVSALR